MEAPWVEWALHWDVSMSGAVAKHCLSPTGYGRLWDWPVWFAKWRLEKVPTSWRSEQVLCLLFVNLPCFYRTVIYWPLTDWTFAIKCQLVKIVPAKISSSKIFLLTNWGSRAQCVCTAETRSNCWIFLRHMINLSVITATANRSSELALSLWHGSFSLTVTDTPW